MNRLQELLKKSGTNGHEKKERVKKERKKRAPKFTIDLYFYCDSNRSSNYYVTDKPPVYNMEEGNHKFIIQTSDEATWSKDICSDGIRSFGIHPRELKVGEVIHLSFTRNGLPKKNVFRFEIKEEGYQEVQLKEINQEALERAKRMKKTRRSEEDEEPQDDEDNY